MNGLRSKFVRKSLGVRPACSLVNLYRSSKLYLPVTSVVEEYKAAKVKAVTTLFLSKDKKISHSSFQEMEASGSNQGSQDILEAPGDCCCDMLRKTWWNNAVGGIMPMAKAKQYLVVKREKRNSWDGLLIESTGPLLPRSVDAIGPGTGAITILGTLGQWPG